MVINYANDHSCTFKPSPAPVTTSGCCRRWWEWRHVTRTGVAQLQSPMLAVCLLRPVGDRRVCRPWRRNLVSLAIPMSLNFQDDGIQHGLSRIGHFGVASQPRRARARDTEATGNAKIIPPNIHQYAPWLEDNNNRITV